MILRFRLGTLLLGWAMLAGIPLHGWAAADTSRFLLVHYMPWFESAAADSHWGWHWTMNRYDPDHSTNGRRDAASKDRPLVDLYSSGDPDLLECQALLMKFSGVDGVVIDWYGNQEDADYGLIQRNTLRLIPWLRRAGLRYTVMYEESTVARLIKDNVVAPARRVENGRELFRWMQAHWFSDPLFLKRENRPIVMVFGSGFYSGEEWRRILAADAPPVELITEETPRGPAAGAFDWPQPSGGTAAALDEAASFPEKGAHWREAVAVAFPRFDDIYAEAGAGKSWGAIEDQAGATYRTTLTNAFKSACGIIQVATWNDWGEGTQIEPSVEFGYRDLEMTQALSRKYLHPALIFTAADLRLPVLLYQLRKKHSGDAAFQAKLDAVSANLFAGKTDAARDALPR